MNELAIYGGEQTVSTDFFKSWPPVDESDDKLVLDALHAKLQARGSHNVAFEEEFKAYNGNKYALFTNSGTAALHMGLVGCGVGAGDHVLVTAYSWSSSATCILHHNAIPVFVDIDFDTILIDPAKIEAAITPRTKAIITVHLHGLTCQMDQINAIAKKHGLKVIEDACQAIGALYDGRKAGTLGDCAAFSLNQNKCLSCGEGGIFVTDDEQIYRDAGKLWSFGETARPEESRDYHAYALGWMYRNNEITAAFARAQLKKYPSYYETLRENGMALDDGLRDVKYLIRPTEPENCTHNYYNYNMRIDFDALGYNGDRTAFRDAVSAAFVDEGVSCRPWQRFILPDMTVFKAKNAYGGGFPWSIPGADEGVNYDKQLFPEALRHCECHLPLVAPLRAPNGLEQIEKIIEVVRKVFANIERIDVDRINKILEERKSNSAGAKSRSEIRKS